MTPRSYGVKILDQNGLSFTKFPNYAILNPPPFTRVGDPFNLALDVGVCGSYLVLN